MVNVTVSSRIDTITLTEEGEIIVDYGEQSNEGGEVDRYQCMDCGETIQLDANNPVFKEV